MNGKILDYEAKRIFDEGRTVEREEQKKALETSTKKQAEAMLLDKMDFALIQKYTNLSLE